MEGMTVNMYRNLKTFWRRRSYQRLTSTANPRRRRITQTRLGNDKPDPSRRRRRFWRIKITPKLRFISPKKLLVKFRDAYVNFMMRIANASALGGAGAGYGAVDYGVGGFGMRPIKEYDEKVIVEIYKSLVMAQGQIVPRDVASINSQGVTATRLK